MHAWETILAAVGGLLLGLGLGLTIARRERALEPVAPVPRESEDARIRASVRSALDTPARELGLSDTVQLDANRIGRTVSQRPPFVTPERER